MPVCSKYITIVFSDEVDFWKVCYFWSWVSLSIICYCFCCCLEFVCVCCYFSSQLLLTIVVRNQGSSIISISACVLEVVFSLHSIFSFYLEVQTESCFSAIKYFSVPFSTYAQPSECFCKSGRDLNVLNSFTCSILSDGRVGLGLCFPLGIPWFIGPCLDMECTLWSLDLWCPFQGSSVTVQCMSSFCLSNICTWLDPDHISVT